MMLWPNQVRGEGWWRGGGEGWWREGREGGGRYLSVCCEAGYCLDDLHSQYVDLRINTGTVETYMHVC